MLKKLFKHEFKDLVKIVKFAWFGILGISVLTSVSILLTTTIEVQPGDATTSLLLGLFTSGTSTLLLLGISTVMLITTILFVIRFYRSMLSSEGYLTHSLPFRADQLLNVKVLTGVLVLIIDVVVILVSLVIAALPTVIAHTTLTEAVEAVFIIIGELYKALGVGYGIALTVEGVILLICSTFMYILFPVLCMSIGQRFKTHCTCTLHC